jgi:hypothetical protein
LVVEKKEFARQLMLGEIDRERGRFVTQRIIDRLLILYSPLFERDLLAAVAEILNGEITQGRPVAA